MPRQRLTLKTLETQAQECGLHVTQLRGKPTRFKISEHHRPYDKIAKPLFHTTSAHEVVAWLEGYKLGYDDGLEHGLDDSAGWGQQRDYEE